MTLSSSGDLGGAVFSRRGRFISIAAILIVLGGCQNVGPIAIDQGRDRYNSIIQSTSKEQTLSNIIRVHNHEPISYMDVSEVDATTTFSGTVSGGLASIGAKAGTSGGTLAGQTGAVAGGVTYSELPLIRYTPLLGQPLVVQLVTPVNPDALASLYDSSWSLTPLLDFSTSFLTLDYDEYYAALNIIAKLDYDQRLELVAEKSEVTKAKDSAKTVPLQNTQSTNVTLEVTNKSGGGGAADALVIYFQPPRDRSKGSGDQILWNWLWYFYRGTQAKPKQNPPTHPIPIPPAAAVPAAAPAAPAAAPAPPVPTVARAPETSRDLTSIDRNRIELRTMPVTTAEKNSNGLISGAPLMKTFSALGILKNATEPPRPKIAFVDLERYSQIRGRPWNQDKEHKDVDIGFYTLLPEDENPGDQNLKPREIAEQDAVVAWLKRTQDDPPYLYPLPRLDFTDVELIRGNFRLGALRRYILIIMDDHAPADAYVAHFEHGRWYYIARDDVTSQKNFNLISLFLTMMAIPSTTPPISPTISVGGG